MDNNNEHVHSEKMQINIQK